MSDQPCLRYRPSRRFGPSSVGFRWRSPGPLAGRQPNRESHHETTIRLDGAVTTLVSVFTVEPENQSKVLHPQIVREHLGAGARLGGQLDDGARRVDAFHRVDRDLGASPVLRWRRSNGRSTPTLSALPSSYWRRRSREIQFRRPFAAGSVLFVAASAACALACSIGWFIATRALRGVGAVIAMPLAVSGASACPGAGRPLSPRAVALSSPNGFAMP
jgi:hypothetical protein